MTTIPVITIDGPAGSGKGSIAARLAQHLGWWILDSGVLYRALAWTVIHCQVSPDDHTALEQLLSQIQVDLSARGHQVSWQGQDITHDLRSEACASMASYLGADPVVRKQLLSLQRQCRHAPGLIADGRDMGTVVFPDATVKIFLQADALERAMRRYKQLKQQGTNVTLHQVEKDLQVRDERDQNRSVAPLVPANDALQIDTTHLSIEEVVALILEQVEVKVPSSFPSPACGRGLG